MAFDAPEWQSQCHSLHTSAGVQKALQRGEKATARISRYPPSTSHSLKPKTGYSDSKKLSRKPSRLVL